LLLRVGILDVLLALVGVIAVVVVAMAA